MGFELLLYPAALLVRALPLPDIYSHNNNFKKKKPCAVLKTKAKATAVVRYPCTCTQKNWNSECVGVCVLGGGGTSMGRSQDGREQQKQLPMYLLHTVPLSKTFLIMSLLEINKYRLKIKVLAVYNIFHRPSNYTWYTIVPLLPLLCDSLLCVPLLWDSVGL